MKNKILELRQAGRTYAQIMKELGCSKSTISYHCGDGQKEKSVARTRKYRSANFLIAKVDTWWRNRMIISTSNFKMAGKNGLRAKDDGWFSPQDVLDKFGMNTECYLSGIKINILKDKHYHFDHITPVSRGGNNLIDNLGILHREVNLMKHNLTNEELIEWCKKILVHNGYRIKRVV